MLFSTGDGPPGFEVMKRHRGHEWIRQNDALLRLPDTSLDRLYAAILTSVIGEGAREVAAARTRRRPPRSSTPSSSTRAASWPAARRTPDRAPDGTDRCGSARPGRALPLPGTACP